MISNLPLPILPYSLFQLTPGAEDLQTARIQQAVDACAASGGGRVTLGPGRYLSGTILLKTGVELHLEAGAVLAGSTDPAQYRCREGAAGARLLGSDGMTALIFAEGAERIALTGQGKLDGQGYAFFRKSTNIPDWIESRKGHGTWVPGFETSLAIRPRPRALILLASCRDVRIELAQVHDSPAWTIHLLTCDDVVLRGLELRGALHGSNTDGIDLDACRNVLIEDCDVFTGDDAIAIKNTNLWGLRRDSRNITVRRCRLRSTTHGFTVGTETQRDFEDIVLEDCRIERPGEFRCITGIGLSILDGAALRRVRISKVTIEDAVAPLQIRLGNVGRGQEVPSAGVIEHLVLEDIAIHRALGVNLFCGLGGHPLRDVCLRNVVSEHSDSVGAEQVLWDVPELPTEFPPSLIWRFLPASSFYFRDIEGLKLSGVRVSTPAQDPRPAITHRRIHAHLAEDVISRDTW